MKLVQTLLIASAGLLSVSAFANEAPVAQEAPQIVVQDVATPAAEQATIVAQEAPATEADANTAAAEAQAEQAEANAATTEEAKEAQPQK